jgi:hypothetical protein
MWQRLPPKYIFGRTARNACRAADSQVPGDVSRLSRYYAGKICAQNFKVALFESRCGAWALPRFRGGDRILSSKNRDRQIFLTGL